ncbi:hypothetical protein BGZ92_002382 [Podila epicladia]|nr:hypothetical protein BGZ92_002382 [Podila epicladia]
MANETPNNGQFNPQFQFNPAAGLMGRMNPNGVNPGMQQQIRNMYGTPTMANAMPNLNPGAMGQNPALSLAQRQAMAGDATSAATAPTPAISATAASATATATSAESPIEPSPICAAEQLSNEPRTVVGRQWIGSRRLAKVVSDWADQHRHER